MRCPFCHHTLVNKGREENYETLTEHVFNPNSIGSPRPVWECDNEKCFTNTIEWDCFWGAEGDFFGGSKEVTVRRHFGTKRSYAALDSDWAKIDAQMGREPIKLSKDEPSALASQIIKEHNELQAKVDAIISEEEEEEEIVPFEL